MRKYCSAVNDKMAESHEDMKFIQPHISLNTQLLIREALLYFDEYII